MKKRHKNINILWALPFVFTFKAGVSPVFQSFNIGYSKRLTDIDFLFFPFPQSQTKWRKQLYDRSTSSFFLGTNASIFNTQDQAVPIVPPAGDFLWHHTLAHGLALPPLYPSLRFLRDVRLMVFLNSLLEVNLTTHLWSLTGTRTVILWPVLWILHLITVWKLLTDLLSGETIKTAGNEWGLDQQSYRNMRRSNCGSNPGSKLMLTYYQSAIQ